MKARVAYQPGDSWLHQMHPLAKLVWMMAASVGIFVLTSPWIAITFLAAVLSAFLTFGLQLRGLRGTRMFLTTAILLGLLQVVFTKQGPVLMQDGRWQLYVGGLEAGAYIAARFLFIVALSYLFVLSTAPNDLAYALMQTGLPYRYGFTLITALRMVPIFEEEAQTVYQAQLARGIEYDRRSIGRFLTLARQFFFPMLVSALSKVDGLAVSMEGRCFGKYPQRTYRRRIVWKRSDTAAMLLLTGLASALAWAFLPG